MLDKYVCLICNPFQIKILLLLLFRFGIGRQARKGKDVQWYL